MSHLEVAKIILSHPSISTRALPHVIEGQGYIDWSGLREALPANIISPGEKVLVACAEALYFGRAVEGSDLASMLTWVDDDGLSRVIEAIQGLRPAAVGAVL